MSKGQTDLLRNHTQVTKTFLLSGTFSNTWLHSLFLAGEERLSTNLASQGHIIWNALSATALWYIIFSRINLGESFLSPTNQEVWVETGAAHLHSASYSAFCMFTWPIVQEANMSKCVQYLTGESPHVLQIQSNWETEIFFGNPRDGNVSSTSIKNWDLSVLQGYLNHRAVQSASSRAPRKRERNLKPQMTKSTHD